MEILRKNRKIFIVVLVLLFILGVVGFVYFSKDNSASIKMDSWANSSEIDQDNNILSNGSAIEEHGDNSTKNNSYQNAYNDNDIYIHIIGEVNNQGLITLKQGQRVVDAIEKAGGVTDNADLSKVNLAFMLSDGQKLRIPSVNDKDDNAAYVTDSSGIVLDAGSAGSEGKKVNINTASQTELETLNGIGPSLAAKIIEFREKNGKFKSVDDLRNVTGIGESKFESIKKSVVVK